MEANELRIGNYILYDGNIVKVWGLSGDVEHISLLSKAGLFGDKISKIKPITLTEEILLKCGFEKIDTKNIPLGYYYTKFPICIIPNESGNDIEIMDNDYSINMGNNSPKYLNQLQNLYFALTGKELEIKL